MWETLLSLSGHAVFWLVLVSGVIMILFGLPGTFVIAGTALVYGWLTDFAVIHGSDVLILFGIAVAGEVIEFLLGAFTAKRFGGSNWAMAGAIIGGFLGAVWATGFLPVIGTLLGAFAGSFVGAFVFEYLHSPNTAHALRVGWGAFLGAVGGKLTKITLAVAMLAMILVRFL
ncbi:MAG: DUF456 domain-containing protein [candidate division KSB1 bacterium]|nr:DUF456 domain-containing protein [candidate division KSB1 bacterium]